MEDLEIYFVTYKNNGGTTSLYFSVNNNSLVINNNNISGNDRFYWDPINSLILDRPGQSNVLSSYGIEISNSGYVNNIYSNSIYMSGTDSYTSMDLVSGFIFNSNNSSTTISATATTFTQTSGYTLTLLSSTFSGNNTQYYPDRSGTFSLVDDIINTSIFYLGGSTTSAADSKTQSVYRTGNIGIGTASPSTKLHIFATQSGAFRLQDGTQADGYILKSDANGLATWAESSVYFNGSGTTPSLPEVLTIGDRLFETPGIRNFEIADRTKYLLCFGGEILTLNESIINFPVNSLIQFRVLDTEASLQFVGTLCYYLDGVTPLTSITLYAGDYCELKKIDLTRKIWILTVSSGSNSAIQRGVFSGAFSLNNATRGGEYVPLTQTGALTLSAGVNAVNGGIDTVKITANGSAITVPGGWINIGSDSISVVNGAVNRIMVRQYQSEIWYAIKVN